VVAVAVSTAAEFRALSPDDALRVMENNVLADVLLNETS
jgi:hypothetical protein